jgi:hypothetical protein
MRNKKTRPHTQDVTSSHNYLTLLKLQYKTNQTLFLEQFSLQDAKKFAFCQAPLKMSYQLQEGHGKRYQPVPSLNNGFPIFYTMQTAFLCA